MSANQKQTISEICKNFGKNRLRLMDIVREVQGQLGHISNESAHNIADALNIPFVEVIDMVSFYSFFSRTPRGTSVVRLSSCVVDKMHGMDEIAKAFEKEVGVAFGNTSSDGKIDLEYTPCIGMCDQVPAILVNGTIMTNLTPKDVPGIVNALRKGEKLGSPESDTTRPDAKIDMNLRKAGPVIFATIDHGAGIRPALNMTPEEVIDVINNSRLRGRGGAGFPTGGKWEICSEDFASITGTGEEELRNSGIKN